MGAWAVGAALALGAAGCTSATDGGSAAQQTAELDAAAFAERVAADGVVVLDVRTPEEFAAGHLPGALNIDVEGGDFADRVAELDPAAPYALYCRSGNRSGVAMAAMADAGFADLAHLGGDIAAWEAAGGQVVLD